jgi:uncharacterized protein (TIGR03790 family)
LLLSTIQQNAARRSRLPGVVCAGLLIGLATSCATPSKETSGKPAAHTPGGRVLVVANERSADGLAIAQHYMRMREVPATNLVTVDIDEDDEVGEMEFRRRILAPIRSAIERVPERVDFVLLTRGIPLRIQGHGYSVDAHIAGMRLAIPPMVGLDTTWLDRYHNPYYNSNEPFDSDRFAMYLVTRIDCAKRDDCIALIDRSLAARPLHGPFFFDALYASTGSSSGYAAMDRTLHGAHRMMSSIGAWSVIDSSPRFVVPDVPLAGYVSWASNDNGFDAAAYHRLRFQPGAIAETFVSTSARTFNPVTGGQSRIVDLIEQGVTGVKGYVSEPYTIALADPQILFNRYLRGFTLAESFYAASRMILWKDIVVGDPLCAPYLPFTVFLPGSSPGM